MTKKVCHILKATKRTALPKNVIFFDTETSEVEIAPKKRELVLKLGIAVLTRRSRHDRFEVVDECRFTEADAFSDWLTSVIKPKEKYYVVAHNIAFDLRVIGLLRYLSSHGWKRTTLIAEGVNFIASFRKGTSTIQLVNNQQLFNVSLKKLGESIGVLKQEVDFRTVDFSTLMTYCRQDVEVMIQAWNTWVAFIVTNDLGNFKITAASQAMEAFRHRFMSTEIFIHNDDRTIALERESYHGGRVECFFIGEHKGGPVYNLDVNSMYPAIMASTPVPVKLRKYYASCPPDVFEKYRTSFGYVVEATFDIDEPILPVANGARLIFPIGTVRGVFTKPEFELALTLGHLQGVHRCAFYDEEIAFKPFVDFFYGARQKFTQEGNKEFAYVSKLLMNSLYGKFGQKQNVYEVIGKSINTPDGIYKSLSAVSGEWEKYRIIEGIVEKSVGWEEGYNSFVATASYITAAARVLLWKYIAIAGKDEVLYCDTDSIFVTEKGRARVEKEINATQLGKLKLVESSDILTIWGPKWYRFGDKLTMKGIRKDARRVGEHTYEQDKFLSFTGGLRSYHTDSVIIETVTKKLHVNYQKGTVLPSGRVEPLKV